MPKKDNGVVECRSLVVRRPGGQGGFELWVDDNDQPFIFAFNAQGQPTVVEYEDLIGLQDLNDNVENISTLQDSIQASLNNIEGSLGVEVEEEELGPDGYSVQVNLGESYPEDVADRLIEDVNNFIYGYLTALGYTPRKGEMVSC